MLQDPIPERRDSPRSFVSGDVAVIQVETQSLESNTQEKHKTIRIYSLCCLCAAFLLVLIKGLGELGGISETGFLWCLGIFMASPLAVSLAANGFNLSASYPVKNKVQSKSK